MAIIHRTTLTPTKLELLTAWLPGTPWYDAAGEPELAKAGGFRLDDPAGEVGIEFMVVTDTAGAGTVSLLVPMTYRGAPADGLEHALIGTTEHGVLGTRWVYDGVHDPVLLAQLGALLEGRAQPQAQSVSDAVDQEVTWSRDPAAAEGTTPRPLRVLRPGSEVPEGAAGHVEGAWQLPDGSRVRGVFAVLG
ncbi:1,4-alpha-glucan branching protein [Streptomyces sp. NPDC090106]|uniref:maltokinase N-terminal cap-like domain-containing protein n=1 Tax=Streptomyces sp. NPDC090106 TaxID=3365946 RepID=UPI00381545BC